MSGAFLARPDEVEKNLVVWQSLKTGNFFRVAGSIRQHFLISKDTVLMRLLTLKKISPAQYGQGRDTLHAPYEMLEAKRRAREQAGNDDEAGFGGISLDRKCVAEKGEGYISLVMENIRKGHISNSDALDYLDVKLRHLEKFQDAMGV